VPKRGLTESFNNAIEGLTYAAKTQRNFRVHLGVGIGVLLFSVLLGVGRLEFMLLLLTISLVIISEMLNTAVELLIDLTKDHFHPIARSAKDVAAGAVLFSALSAFCVGCFVFAERFKKLLEGAAIQVRFAPWHVSFIALATVLILVITIKLFFHKGTPVLGGMPSGHAAFAFSLWALIWMLQSSLLVTALVLVLAILVAYHRVRAGFHTFFESTAGAALGIFVTFLVMKFMGL